MFLDVSLLIAGFGSVSIFFTVETYLLVSFLLVHPGFKVGGARVVSDENTQLRCVYNCLILN